MPSKSNAIKFSDTGEVVVEVHLTRMGQSEGLLRVHVVDNGIGVTPDKHNELFQGFSRSPIAYPQLGLQAPALICFFPFLVWCLGSSRSHMLP